MSGSGKNMSRIGKLPIKLPTGVTLSVNPPDLEVKGPKGDLRMKVNPAVSVEVKGDTAFVKTSEVGNTSLHGLTRSLISNMVKGVAEGWSKTLELSGTGYRASTTGTELQLNLGFSHPVSIKAPAGVTFEVKETKITIKSADKMIVGEIAAKIRGLKPADPYKAKGFKYEGEVIIKKAGKAAKAGA